MAKKADAEAPEPTKSETPATTNIVAARKIITVSHDGEENPAETSAAEPATPIIKKSRIEPLSAPTSAAEAPAETEVSAEVPAAATPEAKAEDKPKTEIAPITSETKTDEPEPSKPVAEEPSKPAEDTPATEEEKPDEEVPPAESGFSLDEGDSGQHPMDEAQSKEEKEAADKQAALNKLVDSETYFLPINAVEKRRAKQLVWVTVLLVVVLAAAAGAWAHSAGYVTIPGL